MCCHGYIWQMRRTDKKNLNVWIWSAFSWSIMKGFFKSTFKMKYMTSSRKQYYRDVSNKANLPSTRHPYFQLRDEMLTQVGFIFKGDRVFIPLSLWSEFKRTNHSLHTSINWCLRRATECIFCSSMSLKIREYIFIVKQPKETLMLHNIPGHLWQKNGVDIFKSDCWLFFELEDNATSVVMRKLKSRFASYGISDAGPSLRPRHLSTFQKNNMLTPHGRPHKSANVKAESQLKAQVSCE